MIPVDFPGRNFVYTAPKGTEEMVADLPVMVQDDSSLGRSIVSVWQPNEEERAALASGAHVTLVIYANSQPIVGVGVAYVASPTTPSVVN